MQLRHMLVGQLGPSPDAQESRQLDDAAIVGLGPLGQRIIRGPPPLDPSPVAVAVPGHHA